MDDYQLLKLKRLKAHQTFLESDYEEKNHFFTLEVVPLFHKDFAEIIPEAEKQEYKKERKKPRKLVNDVFKKLSTKLHPDKGGDKELFQQANEAKENNNLSELMDIANQINMKIEDDETMIPILEEKNSILQNKVDVIVKSLAWQWYHMSADDRKINKPKFLEVLRKQLDLNI
tara:strand:+ start:281 stop:799 length:519 start_codon:yes stop_codon:yes gene_type:complete